MASDLKPAAARPLLTLPAVAALGLLGLAGYYALKTLTPEHGDPVAASLLAFEKQDRLTVFSAQITPVVSADDVRVFGIFKSRQVAVIPARIDYTIDLSKMDGKRMRWDAATKRLAVTLPPLQLSPPNLDEAHAQYLREGVWITGDAQAKLTRDNTITAQKLASDQARNPVLLNLAKEAARGAMRQNLAIPLQVAGYGDVTVSVRFDGEAAPN